jgi:hypothetical protein
MKRLLLYSSKKKDTGERLQNIIEGEVNKEGIEVYHSIDDLNSRLHQPHYDVAVIILSASGEEMDELIQLRDLINDIPVIFILPDMRKDTLSKAFKLFPRYISEEDSNFSDVVGVLKKMVEKIKFDKPGLVNRSP